LVEWLQKHQVTTVAMEATGIYWLSLYDKLETAGLDVYLVDRTRQSRAGRKSDWLDCQWLQKSTLMVCWPRLPSGLASAAVAGVNPSAGRTGQLRHGPSKSHGQALVAMNLHLSLAVSDLVGTPVCASSRRFWRPA